MSKETKTAGQLARQWSHKVDYFGVDDFSGGIHLSMSLFDLMEFGLDCSDTKIRVLTKAALWLCFHRETPFGDRVGNILVKKLHELIEMWWATNVRSPRADNCNGFDRMEWLADQASSVDSDPWREYQSRVSCVNCRRESNKLMLDVVCEECAEHIATQLMLDREERDRLREKHGVYGCYERDADIQLSS